MTDESDELILTATDVGQQEVAGRPITDESDELTLTATDVDQQEDAPQEGLSADALAELNKPELSAEAKAALSEPETTSAFDDFTGMMNAAIADSLDLIPRLPPFPGFNKMLEALGIEALPPRGTLRDTFVKSGLAPEKGKEPESVAGSAGHMVGATALLALGGPMLTGIKAATLGTIPAGIKGVVPALKEGFRELGESIVRTPVVSTVVDLFAASAAGSGGFVAKKKFPKTPAAEMVGNLLGGFSPIVVVGSIKLTTKGVVNLLRMSPLMGKYVVTPAVDVLSTAREMLLRGPQTLARRVGRRVAAGTTDSAAAVKALDSPTGAPLTPAQQTGDPLLLAIEKSIIESSDRLGLQSDEQIVALNEYITSTIRQSGNPAATREAYEAARQNLINMVALRARLAGLEADKKIAALGPKGTKDDASEIVARELDAAEEAARATEREVYALLSPDIVTPATIAQNVLRREVAARGRTSDPEDIPEFVTKLLSGKTKDDFTFDEVRVLRSRILREIRAERRNPTAPNKNKIRILDDLQEALLADLGALEGAVTGPQGEALRLALSVSHDLNMRFGTGVVGRLLKGEVTPDRLTLKSVLGAEDSAAAENVRQMVRAVRDNPEETVDAMLTWIKADFTTKTVRSNQIDSSKAELYLRNNQSLLDEFPGAKAAIEKAIATQDTRALRQGSFDRIENRLGKTSISKATVFIKKGPKKAFDEARQSRKPGTEAQNLVNLAAKDKTGEATEGLQAAFTEWLLGRAMAGQGTDAVGQAFVSGRLLRRMMNEPETTAMAEIILTKQQRKNVSDGIEAALKMDVARTAKPSKEGIIEDTPNMLIDLFTRIGAAQFGRVIAGKLGGGTVQTPGMMSERARTFLRNRVKDPATRLLVDAFTSKDPELLRAILANLNKPKEIEFVRKQLNAWLANIGFENKAPIITEGEMVGRRMNLGLDRISPLPADERSDQ